MIQWMGRSAELDPRAGGGFRCDINGARVARGEYVAVERPGRIVFTWGWEGEEPTVAPGGSTVEVLLDPRWRGNATAPDPQRPAERRVGRAATATAGATTSSGSRSSRPAATRAPTPGSDADAVDVGD